MPRARKEFYKYIRANSSKHPLTDYSDSPASAFLKYAIDAVRAYEQCERNFQKNMAGDYVKGSLSAIQIINAGLLATIMGNFETYQKYLFANMFEYSIYLNKFDVAHFLGKFKSLGIDITKLAAYRNNEIGVGLIIAENLKNWQTPISVNTYFKNFELEDAARRRLNIYSNDTQESLSILWQMRHSIVHTASTITIPDSQKVEKLAGFGNKTIALEPNFISEVVRKLHPIIQDATNNMKSIYLHNLKAGLDVSLTTKIDNIFAVSSPRSSWL
jgi:hypothetical protein